MKIKVYKIFKRIFFIIANLITLIISFVIPKTDEIIVVGGWFGERFADNSKYFFLYVNENKNKLKIKEVIWITRNNIILKELKKQGYKVCKAWSFMSIWYHFRARIHIIDQSSNDINPFFSVRSKRINLWHGFPLKKIGSYQKEHQNKKKNFKNRLFHRIYFCSIPGYWGKNYLLATSGFSSKILGEAFECSKNEMLISGYPRNYEVNMEKPIQYISEKEKPYLDEIKKHQADGNAIIGYFPTFRDERETLLFGTNNPMELKEILDFFEENNIKVAGKFHFAGKGDQFKEANNHEVFINLPSDADVYSFLSEIDILITDYSSIYFDYLLWSKPIIFFPYDLEYYRDQDRGLIFDYEEFTPGPKAFNISDLKGILAEGVTAFTSTYKTEYENKSLSLQKRIFTNNEDMEIEHLIQQIKQVKV